MVALRRDKISVFLIMRVFVTLSMKGRGGLNPSLPKCAQEDLTFSLSQKHENKCTRLQISLKSIIPNWFLKESRFLMHTRDFVYRKQELSGCKTKHYTDLQKTQAVYQQTLDLPQQSLCISYNGPIKGTSNKLYTKIGKISKFLCCITHSISTQL